MRTWARLLIERQVRHLARLLDDLLNVSRLAHGKFAYRPDVAVLDIGMPMLNGYDVAQRVRNDVPHTVLIALSGWGSADDVARA